MSITPWFISAGCALLMGAAIQRGATCLVAGVLEWREQRKTHRLMAMLQAGLLVGLGLGVAVALHAQAPLAPRHALGGLTLLGGALLGLGAWVNRACVFGTIARVGGGDWAYLASPLGFFAGCWAVEQGLPTRQATDQALPTLSPWLLPAVSATLLAALLWRSRERWWRADWWSPHLATWAIGITFLVMLLLVGPWAYTDVLAELAQAMRASPVADLPWRLALLACLLGGAVLGGWRSGRWQPSPPRRRELLRCFSGGLLMGLGSLLIPGGNDGLILLGLPLLWPYAWAAVLSMAAAITAAHAWSRRA